MMNKKEIFKKIGSILTELTEQYEYLSQNPDNLNELELELFSANANFLSDHLSILVKLNGNPEKPAAKSQGAVEADQVVDTEELGNHKDNPEEEQVENNLSDWKSELEKEPGLTFEFEEKQADKLFDRPLAEEKENDIEENIRLKTPDAEDGEKQDDSNEQEYIEEAEELQPEEDSAQNDNNEAVIKEVIISERTIAVPAEQAPKENPVPTVNDLLSRNISQQTVASQFNFREVKDLKGLISLNDKLLFVRDLFNGYSLAYSEAIELLNRFDSFEAADNFLKQNYASKNNWAQKQDVTDKFYELLNRRFSK